MKTLELKLKKYVLIVNAEGLEITQGLIFNKFGNYNLSYYDYICKGSELTEEIASELVNETIMYEKHKVKCYRYRSYKEGFVGFDNAIESFISAVESKGFYWLKNPIDEPNKYVQKCMSFENLSNQFKLFDEKEEKTFKNPLIFVRK